MSKTYSSNKIPTRCGRDLTAKGSLVNDGDTLFYQATKADWVLLRRE
jgi:hypothetical protein